MQIGMRIIGLAGAAVAIVALTVACAGIESDPTYPTRTGRNVEPYPKSDRATIFGPGGINFFGDDKKPGQVGGGGGGGGIGVNSFLWRASLDTLAFMPLSSADPFGGVIITDWFSPPETPGERFKMTVYILDRRLRADGLRVAVFRQQRADGRAWTDSTVNDQTPIDLENAILTRARQLRMNFVQQ